MIGAVGVSSKEEEVLADLLPTFMALTNLNRSGVSFRDMKDHQVETVRAFQRKAIVMASSTLGISFKDLMKKIVDRAITNFTQSGEFQVPSTNPDVEIIGEYAAGDTTHGATAQERFAKLCNARDKLARRRERTTQMVSAIKNGLIVPDRGNLTDETWETLQWEQKASGLSLQHIINDQMYHLMCLKSPRDLQQFDPQYVKKVCEAGSFLITNQSVQFKFVRFAVERNVCPLHLIALIEDCFRFGATTLNRQLNTERCVKSIKTMAETIAEAVLSCKTCGQIFISPSEHQKHQDDICIDIEFGSTNCSPR